MKKCKLFFHAFSVFFLLVGKFGPRNVGKQVFEGTLKHGKSN